MRQAICQFVKKVGINMTRNTDTSCLLFISNSGLDKFVNGSAINRSAVLNISCCAVDYFNQFRTDCNQSHIICYGELAVIRF